MGEQKKSKVQTLTQTAAEELKEMKDTVTQMKQEETAQKGLMAVEEEKRKKFRAGQGGLRSLITSSFGGVKKDTLG